MAKQGRPDSIYSPPFQVLDVLLDKKIPMINVPEAVGVCCPDQIDDPLLHQSRPIIFGASPLIPFLHKPAADAETMERNDLGSIGALDNILALRCKIG
jgi:hypothetical protein